MVTFHGTPMSEIGMPDIFGSIHSFAVVIEMKNEDGKLSKIQEYRLEQWEKAGALAFAARSEHEVFTRLAQFAHEKGFLWP